MKLVTWAGVVYLVAVGAATFASGSMANSPTADSIAKLPSVGSFLGSTGSAAAAMDIAVGGALWFFLLR